MKKLRCIGYKQTFNIKYLGLLNKVIKKEEGWVIRGIHYFYVDDTVDISELYLSKYTVRRDTITGGWGDWVDTSSNVDVRMSDSIFSNIQVEIIEYNLEKNPSIKPSMKDLWDDMSADEFKEWFNTM